MLMRIVSPLFMTTGYESVGEGEYAWNESVQEFFETRFAGFTTIAIPAFIVSYIFFFGIGGFLHVSLHKILTALRGRLEMTSRGELGGQPKSCNCHILTAHLLFRIRPF